MNAASIAIIAKPRSRTAGIIVDDRGIVVSVREPAHEGQANDACRRALAKALNVAPSRVMLVRGSRSKQKVFRIEGIAKEAIIARLAVRAS
jgi:uncharacterized protein